MGTLTALLLVSCLVLEVLTDTSINYYLEEKLKRSKVEIAKLHIRDSPPVQVKSYNVQWDKLWNEPVGTERAFIANMFDRIFVLKSNRVMELSVGVTLSNETSALQEVARIRCDESIKFVRSTVWGTLLYLLVCYETGSCSLYTGTNNLQLRHRQIIHHRGFPMDACFFTRANQLYLVVADNSGKFATPSVIYHWRGTYMDVVAEVMTVAAVAVTTFEHRQSTIIVFTQYDKTSPRIGSVVYEFKEATVDRIQFLPTFRPMSIQHYDHGGFKFILLLNELSPSNLFWWDGKELLNWQQLPEIRASSLIQIVNFDGNTFFFVGHEDVLEVYKFQNGIDSIRLDSVKLKHEEHVIDMRVQIDGRTMTMILVILNQENIYSIQAWELRIKEAPHEASMEETESPSKCLAQLIDMIEYRKPIVEKAQSLWPSLLPSTENLTISQPLVVSNLILEAGTIKDVELITSEEITVPREIQRNLEEVTRELDNVLSASQELLTTHEKNVLVGNILVDGDAYFDELHINSVYVDYLNGVRVRLDDNDLPKYTMENSTLLEGRKITIDNLQVDSLCGIPSKYWAKKDDTSRFILDTEKDNIEFKDDTVILHSDASYPVLKVKTLNDMNVEQFVDELFLLNSNQVIKGNLKYKSPIRVTNLTMQMLNEEASKSLITAMTNQTLEQFWVQTLRVNKLYAERINGVPVSEAARVSRENVIKGKVRLVSLTVSEKFTAESGLNLPKVDPVQIYSNVTIHGDLTVNNVDLDERTRLSLKDREVSFDELFATHWTKSSDQTIENEVTLEGGVIIDRLNTQYLNGFLEHEFLYTTTKEISEIFKNLLFDWFYTSESFYVAEKTGIWQKNLFEIAPESLTIGQALQIEDLRVNDLSVDVFNGIQIDDILNGKERLVFVEDGNFASIRANKVNVSELQLRFINDEILSTFLEKIFDIKQYLQRDFPKFAKFQIESLSVERINDFDVRSLWNSLEDLAESNLKDLTLNGNLRVRDNLNVKRIGEQPAEMYLHEMMESDMVASLDMEIDDLTVENFTLNLLHGHNLDTLFRSIFTHTKEQTIPGQFSFFKIRADNIQTNFLNDQDMSKLMWIDKPLILNGNVTFKDLFVEGDVLTEQLNGYNINQLYDNMLKVPTKEIHDLTVKGNITWKNPSSSRTSSISYLLENAITKNTNQIITGVTIFENDVTVSRIKGRLKEFEEIRDIISDTVLENERTVTISGRKHFTENLTLENLSVYGDIRIPRVNDIDILVFNDSVLKKDREEVISSHVTFLEDVTIGEMFTNDTIHGVRMDELALPTDTLPNNILFKNLVVLKDVYLDNLDGINFDEFVKDRITLDGNNEVLTDIQFNGIVEVKGKAIVEKINGIRPSEFVLNGLKEPQFISGKKTFEKGLVVNGNLYASLINDMNLLSKYNEGIQNDEDVEIFGDLIFEDQTTISKDTTVSGKVNGRDLRELLARLKGQMHDVIRVLKENETLIDEKINRALGISNTLGNVFSHLETEDDLKIIAPNIKKVDVVYFEGVTKLNMYGEEDGTSCGLPETCSCPTEYVAELTKEECNTWKNNDSVIVRNFHESNGIFGINVVTNTISNSPECMSRNTHDEYTTISRMRHGTVETNNVVSVVEDHSLKIQGYLKDAQVFTHNHEAFVVLAISYDPVHMSYKTDSLIYKYNFDKDELSLHQKVPTHGAWAMQIFKTDYPGAHLLIGCFGDSSTSAESTQSLLYRFDVVTSKFILMRAFAGKSRYVKNLSQGKDVFVLLDDFETNAVNVFHYNPEFDNFYHYQSLFHDSHVNGIETFHADEYGNSDSFVIVTTEGGQFFVYEYMFAEKFQVKVHYWMDGLQTMAPFYYSKHRYIFVGTAQNSTILRIVQQGPH